MALNSIVEDGQDSAVVVAVMGVTGSGKSTFVQLVSGREDVAIGHGLSSATKEVTAYPCSHRGMKYVLVDTPGFDETSRPPIEVVGLIMEWLKGSAVSSEKLNAVLFLHPINSPRMQGTALRNTRVFRRLVGNNALKNVVLATTFWETVPRDVATRREQELQESDEFWASMLEQGAQIARLPHSRVGALELLERVSENEKALLSFQHEITTRRGSVAETTVGRFLVSEEERLEQELKEKHAAEKLRLQEELREYELRQLKELSRQKEEIKRILVTEREAGEAERRTIESDHHRRLEKMQKNLEIEVREREKRWQLETQSPNRTTLRLGENVKRREVQHRRDSRQLRAEMLSEVARGHKQLMRRAKHHYSCSRPGSPKRCSLCRSEFVTGSYYYHCCFCTTDKYVRCESCGPKCQDSWHLQVITP